ncbi:serine/threonine protein kinase [uncultured Bartonella sp.]|uniref:serine/threonine protein kinase n=1 Tax=uncultured Bartonella sp. TaxID=104108 RepID=UPI0025CB9F7B|nr:serine/threonine protein kinase [uncultured Bartonella sp.]
MEHFADSDSNLPPLKDPQFLTEFVALMVLKRDVFSETRVGYFADDPHKRVIRRIVTAAPRWSRPLAWILARREIRALKKIRGLEGVPQLIAVDKDGLYRSWSEGTPLHLARPNKPEFYLSAFKILRNLRRMGITHNDLAKPQNWLMTSDGKASIIDFQLASVHKHRGALYRYFAYEDFRHLIKQKRSFAPELMTPTEKRILKNRSWPSRLWLATGKRIYNFITKDMFKWSDGDGTGDRVQHQGPVIRNLLKDNPDIGDIAIATYSLPAKGVGLYVFVESDKLDEKAVRDLLKGQKIESLQVVHQLPKREDGSIRDDIIKLVAMNELVDLVALIRREPDLKPVVAPIIDNRKNLTDRRVYQYEAQRKKK